MSQLYLVRHGQASFGSDDYDILSERGAQQSGFLGEHWGQKREPTALYVGPRRRHIDTKRAFRDRYRQPLPEPVVEAGLDEFPVFGLATVVKERYPEQAAQIANAIASGKTPLDVLNDLAARWVNGELTAPGLETFAEFESRVLTTTERALDTAPRGSHVLFITSAGPIAVIVKKALALSADQFLPLASALFNTSVSEFRFRSSADLSLLRFNATPHLRTDSLLTHR